MKLILLMPSTNSPAQYNRCSLEWDPFCLICFFLGMKEVLSRVSSLWRKQNIFHFLIPPFHYKHDLFLSLPFEREYTSLLFKNYFLSKMKTKAYFYFNDLIFCFFVSIFIIWELFVLLICDFSLFYIYLDTEFPNLEIYFFLAFHPHFITLLDKLFSKKICALCTYIF